MKAVWKAVGQFFRTADIFLLIVSLVASAYGIVLISSAGKVILVVTKSGERYLTDQSARLVTVQCVAVAIGFILFIVLSCVPLDFLSRFWKWVLAFNVAFILLLYIWGMERGGNKSWLEIPGFPVAIQPAEVVKIGFILVLAKQISAFTERERLNSPPSAVLLVAHLGLMAGIIFMPSKDIGMIVMYTMIFFSMCLAGGLKLHWFALGSAALAGAAPILWNFIGENQQNRIMYGFNPDADPGETGYQAIHSRIAIGGGGMTGQGLYNGLQIQQGKLPEKQTDFIFSVAGEELGFIGCIAILLLLSVIVVRCLYVATRSKTQLASVVCVGVAGMILFQTIINVGMCLALTPVIGLTLPFFSYGGSSVITMFAAMGMVSSAHRHPKTHMLSDD